MKAIIEFYPEMQGRPITPGTIDFESGQTPLTASYIELEEEYAKVEALLDRLLNEQLDKLEQMVIEARQTNLHLASMSDEDIESGDCDGS